MGKKKRKKSKKGRKKKTKGDVVEFYTGTNAFILPNGDEYVGEYMAHISGLVWREGKGRYTTHDGQVYEGVWKNDKLIDKSIVNIKYQDGACYDGMIEKNKYNGPGTYTFDNGMCVSGDFADNKMKGSILMIDYDGRLWQGKAKESSALLLPEHPFYNNINEHRGKSKRILRYIEPEWAPLRLPPPDLQEGPISTLEAYYKEMERIFGKSFKTDAYIDFSDGPWVQDFVNYKNQRAQVLMKLHERKTLTTSELEWYKKYLGYKKLVKEEEAQRRRQATKLVDTSLLETFYSKAFRDSSKPVRVIYPSYKWRQQPLEEETKRIKRLSVEEFDGDYDSLHMSQYGVIGEEFDEESKEMIEGPERTRTIGLTTESLFDFIDESLGKKVKRVCLDDL